MGNQKTKEGEK